VLVEIVREVARKEADPIQKAMYQRVVMHAQQNYESDKEFVVYWVHKAHDLEKRVAELEKQFDP
jgi:hypothetical protein